MNKGCYMQYYEAIASDGINPYDRLGLQSLIEIAEKKLNSYGI